MRIINNKEFDLDASIRKHFPYSEFFDGQFEAIQKIASAFLSGKKFVIAQIPTGVGKSAIAFTVHKVIREADSTHRTTITTVTKALQDQYKNEFNEITDLRGKTNYDCPKGVGPYNSAACRKLLLEKMCDRKVCPYVIQRTEWCNSAPIRITNSSFMIEACPMLVMEPENRANLIVVDECHTLDTHLVDHSTLDLQSEKLTSVTRVLGSLFTEPFFRFNNAFKGLGVGSVVHTGEEEGLANMANRLHTMLEEQIENLNERVKKNPDSAGGLVAAIEEMQSISDKLNLFGTNGGEWIIQEYQHGKKLVLKPVYAYQVSGHSLFRKADQFLLMSATICGYDEFARNLGLKEYEVVEIPNPIPKENRPVYNCNLMKVAGQYDPIKLTKLIDRVISNEKGSGVIHTVSYKLAKDIMEDSRFSARMLIHESLEETMDWLRSGGIVLSPSMEQGYDFKGDLARWQIVAKYPYDYLGDPWIKLNVERSQKWYSRRSVLRVVQAAGRVVRGVADYGRTYVIDSEFDRSLKYNRDLYPDWFLDAIKTRNELEFMK